MRRPRITQHGIQALALSLFLLVSCGNPGGKSSEADESGQDIIKKEVILSPETQDLLNRFPTPLELSAMLSEAKAPYIFSLSNSPESLSRYFTEKTKSLNLGIYSADLAYASEYRMAAETEKFFYCTGRLAVDLGIAGVYDKALLDKVNSYKDNRDSLIALAKNFFAGTSAFLRRNNRNQVAVLVAAGAFTEGIYIASNLCQLAKDNRRLGAVIFGQKESLDRLLSILNEYGDDSNIRPVADELAKLKPVFTDYGLGSGNAIPYDKASAISDIAGKVRSSMTK